jgi:hypothetical protein
MIEVSVVFSGSYGMDDLKAVIHRHGGRWEDIPPGAGYGVVQRGDAALFATLIPQFQVDMCSDEQLATFRQQYGRDPRSRVAIEISHSPGSRQLASEFVTRIATEWEGVADWSLAGLDVPSPV